MLFRYPYFRQKKHTKSLTLVYAPMHTQLVSYRRHKSRAKNASSALSSFVSRLLFSVPQALRSSRTVHNPSPLETNSEKSEKKNESEDALWILLCLNLCRHDDPDVLSHLHMTRTRLVCRRLPTTQPILG
ncbi:unnamed protein product, partial [Ectocarpus sp. 13 AM-2016]